VEYNFFHENSGDRFMVNSGGSTNSLETNTFYNASGNARTGYAKWIMEQGSGNMLVGGSVGIGTTAPGAKLDVRGKINTVQGGRTLSLGDGSYANHILLDSNVDYAFNYNNSSTGGFGFFGGTTSAKFMCSYTGTLTVSGDMIAYGTPSDISFKTNIKSLNNSLEKITQLRGVSFTWKDDVSINQMTGITDDIGFIAQEVQEVLPNIVRENENGKLSLRDKAIIPLLVEAIKEQQHTILSLQSRIETLENQ